MKTGFVYYVHSYMETFFPLLKHAMPIDTTLLAIVARMVVCGGPITSCPTTANRGPKLATKLALPIHTEWVLRSRQRSPRDFHT